MNLTSLAQTHLLREMGHHPLMPLAHRESSDGGSEWPLNKDQVTEVPSHDLYSPVDGYRSVSALVW